MTQKQKIYKNALLRQLHVSSRYINLYKSEDDLYREFLFENFGVKSSKDLDIEALKNLVAYMNFKAPLVKAKKSFAATTNQTDYILTLWEKNSLKKDVYSLFAFAKKIIKKDLVTLDELSKNEAKTLINAVGNIKPPKVVNNTNYKGSK